MKPGNPSSWWRRLVALLAAHCGQLAGVVAAALAAQALAVAAQALAAGLVGLAGAASAGRVAPPLAALVSVVLAAAAASWIQSWLAQDLAFRAETTLRLKLYDSFELLSPALLLEKGTGEVAGVAMTDVTRLQWFYSRMLGALAAAVLVPAAALAGLAFLHPAAAAILAPFVVGAAVVPLSLRRRAERQGEALRAATAAVQADVLEAIQGLREIALFGRGEAWRERLAARGRALARTQTVHAARMGLENAVTAALTAAGGLAALALAVRLAARGEVPPARIPLLLLLAAATFGPVAAAVHAGARLGLVRAAARRVLGLLDRPAAVIEAAGETPAKPLSPHLAFAGVRFAYDGRTEAALQGVSFAVRAGETVALVGESGAGKSTCVQLLLRFRDVAAGAVTVGGIDVRRLPAATLRQTIAVVPQEVFLFDRSLADNLRLGRPEATDEELEAAARAAQIHGFIAALPEGYGTRAGEGGAALSGGDRQALVTQAPILVMDEASSSLDTENERRLGEALRRMRGEKTILLIAHRLSTVRLADRVVVLEAGRVAEEGTAESLLATGRVFPRLFASQARRSPP